MYAQTYSGSSIMPDVSELQHWGIKGQKWGVRRYQNEDGTLTPAGKKRYRYQNPDGSLTEEGKRDYMTAAKKGKLDYKKLSDNDLNMINSRFAREETYKKNVEKYKEGLMSTKIKKAVVAKIASGGKNGGGGKGGGIGALLAMPIKQAFTDAFKDSGGGKGDGGGGDDDARNENFNWKKLSDHGHRFTNKFVQDFEDGTKDSGKLIKALRDSDVDRGRQYMDATNKPYEAKRSFNTSSSAAGRMGTRDTTKNGTSFMEARVAAAKQRKAEARDVENQRQKANAAARRRERELEERMRKSGLVLGHSAIIVRRDADDELQHWGIKGQKWGVRRYQNEDGTLTEAGKERYGTNKEQKRLVKGIKTEANSIMDGGESYRRLKNAPQVQDTLRKTKETADKLNKITADMEKIEHDYYNNENAYNKYTAKLAKQMADAYGESQDYMLKHIRYDDFDQGESFQLYLNDNSKLKKTYNDLENESIKAMREHRAAIKSYADAWLGKHANDTVKSFKYGGKTYKTTASGRMTGLIYSLSTNSGKNPETGRYD